MDSDPWRVDASWPMWEPTEWHGSRSMQCCQLLYVDQSGSQPGYLDPDLLSFFSYSYNSIRHGPSFYFNGTPSKLDWVPGSLLILTAPSLQTFLGTIICFDFEFGVWQFNGAAWVLTIGSQPGDLECRQPTLLAVLKGDCRSVWTARFSCSWDNHRFVIWLLKWKVWVFSCLFIKRHVLSTLSWLRQKIYKDIIRHHPL